MKNQFNLPTRERRFDTLRAAMKESLKKPYIGVTQGGSSRKYRGAKVAATTATTKQPK